MTQSKRSNSPSPLFNGKFVSEVESGSENSASAVNAPAISVVVPMFNEEGGAAQLVDEIARALAGERFEIIIVDDASTDATTAILEAQQARVPQLRLLTHGKNAGQSRALRTGILAARGAIIATLDGDGQNNPADLPALITPLRAADRPALLAMVAGERQKRQDSAAKKMASKWANRIRSRLLRDGAADTGCGLKAFFREAYLRLPYFDHSHRYLPALMRREGYAVEFRAVSHRAREHGASKYTNWGRLAVAFRDLFGMMWLIDRARSPIEISEVQREATCDTIEPEKE